MDIVPAEVLRMLADLGEEPWDELLQFADVMLGKRRNKSAACPRNSQRAVSGVIVDAYPGDVPLL